MQIIEIEDGIANRLAELAKAEKQSLSQFVNFTLRKSLRRSESAEYEHKLARFAQSYRENPQRAEDYEVWQDEQIWEG